MYDALCMMHFALANLISPLFQLGVLIAFLILLNMLVVTPAKVGFGVIQEQAGAVCFSHTAAAKMKSSKTA